MAAVDPQQKNKLFLKGYGRIHSRNDDEGMEEFFQKERLFFTTLKRASKDAQEKVSNLTSGINKIESSIDMSKDFETLEKELEQVIEAYNINCRTLIGDPLSQDQTNKAQDPVRGGLLKKLLITASKLYENLEKLLNMNQGISQDLSSDEAKERMELFNLFKIEDVSQTKAMKRYLKDLEKLFASSKREDVIRYKAMKRHLKNLEAKELMEQFSRRKPEDGIQNKAMKRYLNETSDDVARMIERIGKRAAYYTKTEIPKVLASQSRDKEVLTNVATVSTIITAVTAAIITASVGQENPTNLFKAVNAFWFFSLALSVAAVVSSMLDLFRRSYLSHRRPGPGNVRSDEDVRNAHVPDVSDVSDVSDIPDIPDIPPVIQTWIRNSPRVFLAMSIIAFQAGLCLLAFASHQPSATSIITTTITLLSSVALVVTISWFFWHHVRHSLKRTPGKATKGSVEDLQISREPGFHKTNPDLEFGGYNSKRSRSCDLLRFIPCFSHPRPRILCPSNTARNRAQRSSGNSNKETHEENNKHNAPSDFAIGAVVSESDPYKETLRSMINQGSPPSPSSKRFDPQLALNRLRPSIEYESNRPTDASALAINSKSASAILQLSFSFDGKYLAALDSEGHCKIYPNLTDPQPEGKRIETGPDGYLLDMLWFPASHYLALKFQIVSKGSDSSSDLNSAEPHYYAIYDTSGNIYGKTPPFVTEHVQLLHTKIGLAVFKEYPKDSDVFTFELYYPDPEQNVNLKGLTFEVPQVDFQAKESKSQKLRCFSITRDDRYMIVGCDLQTPGKEETYVSVIELHSGMKNELIDLPSGMKNVFEMPLSQDLRRITTSTYTGINRLIFEYNNAPPEMWIFSPKETENTLEGAKKQEQKPEGTKKQKQAQESTEENDILKMVKIYQLPRSTNVDHGRVRFGGRSDEMVIYSRDSGTAHGGTGLLAFWGRTSGSVLSLQRSPNLSEVNFAVCSQTVEGTFFIAYGLKNGELQIWKSERGTKSGTDSSGQDNKNKNTAKSGPES